MYSMSCQTQIKFLILFASLFKLQTNARTDLYVMDSVA